MDLNSKRITDCDFHLLGNCQRGSSCLYRHGILDKNTRICSLWIAYDCSDISCKFRHPSIVPEIGPICKFFLMGRCRKLNCSFSHDMPTADITRVPKTTQDITPIKTTKRPRCEAVMCD